MRKDNHGMQRFVYWKTNKGNIMHEGIYAIHIKFFVAHSNRGQRKILLLYRLEKSGARKPVNLNPKIVKIKINRTVTESLKADFGTGVGEKGV